LSALKYISLYHVLISRPHVWVFLWPCSALWKSYSVCGHTDSRVRWCRRKLLA